MTDAARLMRDRHVHRLVAIDDAGSPVGVVAAFDFVSLFADA
jgi:predicted transcriptional regulator